MAASPPVGKRPLLPFSPLQRLSGERVLLQRVLSAVVAVPIVILLIWLGENTTAALVAAAAAIGIYEFYRLSFGGKPRPLLLLGIAGGVLFSVDAALDSSFTLPLITGAVLGPLLLLALRPAKDRLSSEWAWTVVGVFLIGWTLSHAVLLRGGENGREWLLTIVILTFAIDTGAYLFGRALGRRRLAPSISPGKTWEGAVAALAVGAGAAVAITQGFDLGMRVWQAVVLGLLVGLFAQAGDLAESVVKRQAGAKDAGRMLPGHGGLLDRLDSLIPAVVVLYYFLEYVER